MSEIGQTLKRGHAMRTLLAAIIVLCAFAGPSTAVPPSLSFPVKCELGETCFVQNYVDHDPTPAWRDFACGAASYNGHKGTDFRLLSQTETAQNVEVLAAAAGTVKGVRDGMVDIFARDGGRSQIKGRECGNGLVIDHGDGWETQYCHLRRGSLKVRPRQRVERGQVLGTIGYSGLTDFAHLHLSVRHRGAVVDPFFYPKPKTKTCTQFIDGAPGLWEPGLLGRLRYRDGEVISVGFTATDVTTAALEKVGTPQVPVAKSAKFLFFARVINIKTGDQLRLLVVGPDGFRAASLTPPVTKPQAVYVAYTGKNLKAKRWPAGLYRARAEVIRSGAVISSRAKRLSLR